MKNIPAPNAIPKIIAIANGEPTQQIILFIPGFKKDWHKKMGCFPKAMLNPLNHQWILPYSQKHVLELEQIFGKHILFAFKVGWLNGNHKTDKT